MSLPQIADLKNDIKLPSSADDVVTCPRMIMPHDEFMKVITTPLKEENIYKLFEFQRGKKSKRVRPYF